MEPSSLSSIWLLTFACFGMLGVLVIVLRVFGLLDGPEKRGKKYEWKKDEDPAVAEDSSTLIVLMHKLQFTIMSYVSRPLISRLFPTSLNFYDVTVYPGVEGYVALTIDDCFVRQDKENRSLIPVIQKVLKQHEQKATFFTTFNYSLKSWKVKQVKNLLKDGHELGNHCADDREYDNDTAEAFELDLDLTSDYIRKLTGKPSKWFRAPSGKLSSRMQSVLTKKGMTHVMLDCFANDPHVPDAVFIAETILRGVRSGSIIVIHMPEKGFREWEVDALRFILSGLGEKKLRSVTLSELEGLAKEGKKLQ